MGLTGWRDIARHFWIGDTIDEKLIIEGDFSEEGGYYAMKQLLAAKPDAVFAASDLMAIGAIRAARETGFKVPEDIAFVGFDDLPMASLSNIQLTTMRQPVVQFGAQAVETLIDQIENGNTSPHRIIMDTELIIRESCGANYSGRVQKLADTECGTRRPNYIPCSMKEVSLLTNPFGIGFKNGSKNL